MEAALARFVGDRDPPTCRGDELVGFAARIRTGNSQSQLPKERVL